MVVYETMWVQRDPEKKYEHGWGFTPPMVMFPPDADPAWCSTICREYLSNDEFECYGAVPRKLLQYVDIIHPSFYPKTAAEYTAWKETNQPKQEIPND